MNVDAVQPPTPRRLRALIGGGLRAAFGVGPGYERQDVSSQASFDSTRISGYFVDLRAKTLREPKPFVSGRGRAYGISATMRAQRALGWWNRYVDGEAAALAAFLAEADDLLCGAELDKHGLLWRYDVDVPKYGRRAPWYSCMAQGQVASVLVRAWTATSEARWGDAALAAVRPLIADGGLGIRRDTTAGPVLEECPSEPPSSILNGWIFALWGLWDVGVALGEREPMRTFEASTGALVSLLPEYDLGWWSRYSVFPKFVDVATPFYHRVHLSQLSVMYRLTGSREFAETETRWRRYDRAVNRARAVAIKVAAVAGTWSAGKAHDDCALGPLRAPKALLADRSDDGR